MSTLNDFPYAVDQWVDVLDRYEKWWQAVIVKIKDNNIYVHFYGWPSFHDEHVSIQNWSTNIAPLQTHTGELIRNKDTKPFVIGQVVSTLQYGKKIRAIICNVSTDHYLVRSECFNPLNRIHSAIIDDCDPYDKEIRRWKRQFIEKSHLLNNRTSFEQPILSLSGNVLRIESKQRLKGWDGLSICLPHSDIELIFESNQINRIPPQHHHHHHQHHQHHQHQIFHIHAHRSLLAMHSKYFEQLFFGPFAKLDSSSVHHITVDVLSGESIKAVLFFLYFGQTHIPATAWAEIYHLSIFFQIEELQMEIEERHISTVITYDSICSMWKQAYMFQLSDVIMYIEKHIAQVLLQASESQYQILMQTLTFDMFQILIKLTQQSSFFENQQEIFGLTMDWKDYHVDINKKEFHTFLQSNIYWAEIPVTCLTTHVKPQQIFSDQQLSHVIMYQTAEPDQQTLIIKQFPEICFCKKNDKTK